MGKLLKTFSEGIKAAICEITMQLSFDNIDFKLLKP